MLRRIVLSLATVLGLLTVRTGGCGQFDVTR
jgi:hypothetical protein